MVAISVAQEAVWIHKLLVGLFGHIPKPTMIYCDNQSCVQMLVNPIFHDKSMHIEIRYHFICDMMQKGAIELQCIPTNDQTVDVLIELLPGMKFKCFRERLGVEEYVSLRERER